MGADNPYADQTAKNTGAPWLGGGPTVDVDLEGLHRYATQMASRRQDLTSRAAHLAPGGDPGRVQGIETGQELYSGFCQRFRAVTGGERLPHLGEGSPVPETGFDGRTPNVQNARAHQSSTWEMTVRSGWSWRMEAGTAAVMGP